MRLSSMLLVLGFLLLAVPAPARADANADFDRLARRFLDRWPSFSPVSATLLGDHRFDDRLDELTPAAREREAAFYRDVLRRLGRIDRAALSPDDGVDAAMLEHHLRASLWQLETLQEWAWNPLVYTDLAGSAFHGLMARDFAPLDQRLRSVASRLDALPRFLEQVRATLKPERVPRVHAETAVQQNPGVLSILDELVVPQLQNVEPALRTRLERSIAKARVAVERHQRWLEGTLLPQARGDFRLGAKLFEQKLAFALDTPLSRQEVKQRAQAEFEAVRAQMYEVAKQVYRKRYPFTAFPEHPSQAYRQAVIRAALEEAYAVHPPRDRMLETARELLDETTAFVREKNLVTLPDDPVEVVVMPEFQRGVAVAYCDAPGPLDRGQKTFYLVAPLPDDWSPAQVESFLREYNVYSLRDLTMHEAMPGHYLQLAHANRNPSPLRAALGSGTFVEGWAMYAERLMVDAGYQDGDPLQRLMMLKWYLRAVTNALLDQGVHVDGMSEEEAMRLMVEGAFQEEREAAGKWRRAQLTAAQLSTYFVGYQEQANLRAEVERDLGDAFDPKAYHDALLSLGSPPVRLARQLLLRKIHRTADGRSRDLRTPRGPSARRP